MAKVQYGTCPECGKVLIILFDGSVITHSLPSGERCPGGRVTAAEIVREETV